MKTVIGQLLFTLFVISLAACAAKAETANPSSKPVSGWGPIEFGQALTMDVISKLGRDCQRKAALVDLHQELTCDVPVFGCTLELDVFTKAGLAVDIQLSGDPEDLGACVDTIKKTISGKYSLTDARSDEAQDIKTSFYADYQIEISEESSEDESEFSVSYHSPDIAAGVAKARAAEKQAEKAKKKVKPFDESAF